MDARICAPAALQPSARVQTIARGLAAGSSARLSITDDLAAAVHGTDFQYTGVWLSTGEPADEWDRRIGQLIGYQVNAEVMVATGNPEVKFTHCLPALHNRETEVGQQIYNERGSRRLRSPRRCSSRSNRSSSTSRPTRMPAIKAVMVATIGTAP
jgi:ornithine carbamoyltransferase